MLTGCRHNRGIRLSIERHRMAAAALGTGTWLETGRPILSARLLAAKS